MGYNLENINFGRCSKNGCKKKATGYFSRRPYCIVHFRELQKEQKYSKRRKK